MASGLGIVLQVDTRALQNRLAEINSRDVPLSRRRLVRRVSRNVLRETILRNPVDTARSRSAWVEALQQLGGRLPEVWKGPHPDDQAISEGQEQSRLEETQGRNEHQIAATNFVRYINFLEFGTRKMSAFEMVRRSLQDARLAVPRQPFFCAPGETIA